MKCLSFWCRNSLRSGDAHKRNWNQRSYLKPGSQSHRRLLHHIWHKGLNEKNLHQQLRAAQGQQLWSVQGEVLRVQVRGRRENSEDKRVAQRWRQPAELHFHRLYRNKNTKPLWSLQVTKQTQWEFFYVPECIRLYT